MLALLRCCSVGNAAFAQAFKLLVDQSVRVVNQGDPLPGAQACLVLQAQLTWRVLRRSDAAPCPPPLPAPHV
jgi:hypothetical protein